MHSAWLPSIVIDRAVLPRLSTASRNTNNYPAHRASRTTYGMSACYASVCSSTGASDAYFASAWHYDE